MMSRHKAKGDPTTQKILDQEIKKMCNKTTEEGIYEQREQSEQKIDNK